MIIPVIFEGLDKLGKSTTIQLVSEYMTRKGIDYVIQRIDAPYKMLRTDLTRIAYDWMGEYRNKRLLYYANSKHYKDKIRYDLWDRFPYPSDYVYRPLDTVEEREEIGRVDRKLAYVGAKLVYFHPTSVSAYKDRLTRNPDENFDIVARCDEMLDKYALIIGNSKLDTLVVNAAVGPSERLAKVVSNWITRPQLIEVNDNGSESWFDFSISHNPYRVL